MKKVYVSNKVKDRASANGVSEINDFDLTDIISEVEMNTIGDEEFCRVFTKAVFNVFGWKYYTVKELNNMEEQVSYDFTKTKS
tara:strand:+ start:8140 stop:8388 length:249 start_codon:yes stop_codon:yes gene_type:complete